MSNGSIRSKEDSFDPTKYGRIGTYAEREAQERHEGKPGAAPKYSESEAKILKKRLHFSLR
jgi:hypothetical protein